ncbi:MAG: hypothetical protein M1837_004428 [Sclerophora amabilis]|nr:MAG: hypothetical protein M1837_004428 [Sclerophora amabilis]
MGGKKKKKHKVPQNRHISSNVRERKKGREKPSRPKSAYDLLRHPNEKLTFRSWRSPEGYVFLGKGDVYLTRKCRTETFNAGKTLYIVHRPGENVQRGLQVPTEIFQQVSAEADKTAVKRQQAVDYKDKRDTAAARREILEQYPRIPDKDLQAILSHGFLKGSKRVGRSTVLTPAQKVTLAVGAHVRHAHTQYSYILDTCRRQAAKSGDLGRASEIDRKNARHRIRKDQARTLRDWRAPGNGPIRIIPREGADGRIMNGPKTHRTTSRTGANGRITNGPETDEVLQSQVQTRSMKLQGWNDSVPVGQSSFSIDELVVISSDSEQEVDHGIEPVPMAGFDQAIELSSDSESEPDEEMASARDSSVEFDLAAVDGESPLSFVSSEEKQVGGGISCDEGMLERRRGLKRDGDLESMTALSDPEVSSDNEGAFLRRGRQGLDICEDLSDSGRSQWSPID